MTQLSIPRIVENKNKNKKINIQTYLNTLFLYYTMNFKHEFTFEQRKEESNRVLQKYQDRIPIICEKNKKASKECPDIDKKKYLVPRDLTMGQFLYVVRKRMNIPSEKAIFLFVGNTIAPSTSLISDVYNYHVDKDGFLYITYSYENVFG